jgi:hypothetical protein
MLAAAAAAGAFLVPPAGAFPWPVRPFHRQHPVRGTFDDFRADTRSIDDPGGALSFHFGVDISARDGTPVYAIRSGRYSRENGRAAYVASAGWGILGYWHVRPNPALARGARVTGIESGRPTLLGWVQRGEGHVHLAERRPDPATGRLVYVDPLLGLRPYTDRTVPTIAGVMTYRRGGTGRHPYTYDAVEDGTLSGTVDLVVSAYDEPPLAPPPPWAGVRLPPALLRWRLEDADGRTVLPERTVIDFRRRLYTGAVRRVYAPGTRQNDPPSPGVYNFWLARGLDTTKLPDGEYELWITADDLGGNEVEQSFELTVANGGAGG